MDHPYGDDVMTAAAASIVNALKQHHVTDVRWFRAWRGQPIVWLVTATRAESAALAKQRGVVDTVRSLAAEAGVPSELASRSVVAVRSQESIDRDWRGKWDMAIHMDPRDSDEVKEDAKPAIMAALQPHGVTEIVWAVAYAGYPVLSLITETDLDKAAVAAHDCFRETVQQLLADAGVPGDLVEQAVVTVESQETVDRDFGGSWLNRWM